MRVSTIISSPFGNIELVEEGGFLKSCARTKAKKKAVKMTPVLKAAAEQLAQYFEGELTEFDIPMDPDGTPFQKKVWETLCKVPYGSMCSYQQLAKKVGSPNAARAVGTANARCQIWIIIPCHRVISASGALGGYGSAPGVKQRLLDLEKRDIPISILP